MTLLNIKEVSEMFGVTEITVHNWIKRGIIPAFKMGGVIRFNEAEVLAATQKNKKGGEAQ